MSFTIYQASAPVFIRGLKGLITVLDKAAAHVAAKKIDPQALLQARLFPDMFPLVRQVQIAADFAKGAAGRLAGAELPAYADDETSFDELMARLRKTIAFIEGLDPAAFAGAEDRDITLVRRGETSVHKGATYLLDQALPNFYFHCATAYAILRHNGVEVGKKDYLG